MLSIPNSLNEAIRDFNGSPKQNYDLVISQIKDFVPICGGKNCRYKIKLYGQNVLFYPILLHRQTHSICENDQCERSVSDYSHSVCYRHADIYHPLEYACHHVNCNK